MALPPTAELGLIIIGIVSGAIAIAVLMVYLIGKKILQRRRGRRKKQAETEKKDTQKKDLESSSEEYLQETEEEKGEVFQAASGDTDETTSESPPRSGMISASKRKSCFSSAPKEKTKDRSQKRHVTFGLFPIMVRFQSSHQNSLIDDIVEEEEQEEDEGDEEDESSILEQNGAGATVQKRHTHHDGENDHESMRSAAELAAAWKLKAWTKEYDSLQASMEHQHPQQENMCSPMHPSNFMCAPTASCMSEPPTTCILKEV